MVIEQAKGVTSKRSKRKSREGEKKGRTGYKRMVVSWVSPSAFHGAANNLRSTFARGNDGRQKKARREWRRGGRKQRRDLSPRTCFFTVPSEFPSLYTMCRKIFADWENLARGKPPSTATNQRANVKNLSPFNPYVSFLFVSFFFDKKNEYRKNLPNFVYTFGRFENIAFQKMVIIWWREIQN